MERCADLGGGADDCDADWTGIFDLVADPLVWTSESHERTWDDCARIHSTAGAASVTTSKIGSYHGSVVTAQMLDFAVRHYIKIYEVKPAKSIWRPAEYEIEAIRDVGGLRAGEQELLKDIWCVADSGAAVEFERVAKRHIILSAYVE